MVSFVTYDVGGVVIVGSGILSPKTKKRNKARPTPSITITAMVLRNDSNPMTANPRNAQLIRKLTTIANGSQDTFDNQGKYRSINPRTIDVPIGHTVTGIRDDWDDEVPGAVPVR